MSMLSGQTEEHIEKQEKTLDQLDKKKRPVTDLLTKGDKIMSDPKAPQFLKGHLDKLKAIWDECNVEGDKRLAALKGNDLSACSCTLESQEFLIKGQICNEFLGAVLNYCGFLKSNFSPTVKSTEDCTDGNEQSSNFLLLSCFK